MGTLRVIFAICCAFLCRYIKHLPHFWHMNIGSMQPSLSECCQIILKLSTIKYLTCQRFSVWLATVSALDIAWRIFQSDDRLKGSDPHNWIILEIPDVLWESWNTPSYISLFWNGAFWTDSEDCGELHAHAVGHWFNSPLSMLGRSMGF